jgi:2-isopropylmalate synthase
LLVALKIFYNANLDVNLSLLKDLSLFVEKKTKIPIPPSKPLVGKNAFAHKLDAHVMGVLKNPIVYETISPDLVGNVRHIPMGKYSGPFAIKKKAEMLGVDINDKDIENMQESIVELSTKTASAISDEMFLKIVQDVSS